MNRILIIILAVTLFSVAEVRAQAPDGLPGETDAGGLAGSTAAGPGSTTSGEPAAGLSVAGAAAHAGAKDDVKGLSWFEISTFSPGLKPVDAALIARMEVTWKPKLRAFRRNAQFAAMLSFDPKLKADWKKIAEECTRIIKK